MEGKKATFYITKPLNFTFPQISGTKDQVEDYLNKTQQIEWTTQALLYPDIDFDFDLYGYSIKFRYVKGYILVRYDNPAFYDFLHTQRQTGWFSIPIFRQPNDQYLARFLMTYENQINNTSFNVWLGLFA